jgi:hypothetical protein
MSTQADDKEPSIGSWTNVSCGETDDPTISFQALSLQHSQPAMEDERQRIRCISDDDFYVSAATAPVTKDTESASWFPLVRKVSLDPKTRSPVDFGAPPAVATKSLVDIIPPASTSRMEERQKRGLNVGMTSLPCLDEQTSSRTRKRRRIASRNQALVATDFDQILSQIGFVGGAL